MRLSYSGVFAGGVLLALGGMTARADLISNPNFNNGGNAETHTNAGGFLIGTSGWQALGTTTDPAGGSTYSQFGSGYNGATDYAELNNSFSNTTPATGGWQQVINTTPGSTYTLSFAYNYLSPQDKTTTSFVARRSMEALRTTRRGLHSRAIPTPTPIPASLVSPAPG